MVKTAVLVSGGGTNLQAIINCNLFGELRNCDLAAVISSNPEAYAVTRAKSANIPTYIVDRDIFPNHESFSQAVLDKLSDLDIELVVLAGFAYKLAPIILKAYKNRIINVYPSLMPAFCGEEYVDLNIYEQALSYGVKLSGATAFFVTDANNTGPIIIQRALAVEEDDTPLTLQRRIMEEIEWAILPEAISLYCEGRLTVDGQFVRISH